MYQNILFDLDGTLTDPEVGIANSVAHALSKYTIQVADRKELSIFIGPLLQDSFEKLYGFSKEKSLETVSYYREYFSDKGNYENEVYLGIPDLLQSLKESGKKLIVATSMPEEFSITILKHFGLYDYFDFVAGATMDGSRRSKSDIIRYALQETAIQNLAETIMIWDREDDIIGAKAQNIDSIGVLYGFGSQAELEEAGASHIVSQPKEILDF